MFGSANRIVFFENSDLIFQLKETLAEYNTFESFLSSLSPEAWRAQQKLTTKEGNIGEHVSLSSCLFLFVIAGNTF